MARVHARARMCMRGKIYATRTHQDNGFARRYHAWACKPQKRQPEAITMSTGTLQIGAAPLHNEKLDVTGVKLREQL
eukprot:6202294-Pleurochrysis_carterae.AAC.1